MTDILLPMPKPHQGQREYLKTARRFNLLRCGRRWGKNIVEHRRIGGVAIQGKPCAWFTPTYRMLAEDWRELTNRLAPVIQRRNESEHRIELMGRGSIDMWSLDNPDAPRGRKYALVVINEAAMVKNLLDTWNMVIRPMLADYQGGADFTSTPKGLNGFFELEQAARDNLDWARYHYRTDDNPHIPAGEIAAMRGSMPERVIKQELDAEYVEDGSFFQNVDNAAVLDNNEEPGAHKGHGIYGGLDWALSQDYSVLTLGCRECNRVVFRDRFNQINYQYQRARVIEDCKRYSIRGLLPERNSIGQPNIELLQAAGIPILNGPDGLPGFNTTATTKPDLIQKLAAALEHDGFLVPRDYGDELRAYEVEVTQTGHSKFSAPEGLHDDRVISLALCWWAMVQAASSRVLLFTVGGDYGYDDD
jgi:hypothetical protein